MRSLIGFDFDISIHLTSWDILYTLLSIELSLVFFSFPKFPQSPMCQVVRPYEVHTCNMTQQFFHSADLGYYKSQGKFGGLYQ